MSIEYIKGIFRNVKFSYINTAVLGITTLASSIIYARMLGSERYGIYTYLIWLIGLLNSLFSMGIPQTLTRFIPEYYFNDSKDKLKKLILILIRIQILSSIIIGIMVFYSIPYWKGNIITEYGANIKYLFSLTIITVIPIMLNGIYSAILQAIHRFDITAKNNICIQILIFVFTTANIILFKSILMCIIIILIFSCLQAYRLQNAVHKFIGLNGVKVYEDKLDKKRIFNYSIYMYLNILWQQVVWAKSEYLFLGIYRGTKDVAVYGIGFSLYTVVSSLFAPFMTVINNYFAEIIVKKNDKLLNRMIYLITKYFIILLGIILSCSILYAKQVIEFVYSSEYAEVGTVFLILIIGFCINQILNVSGSITVLYEKQKFVVGLGIVIGIINIGLDILLIPSYGAVGAAFANTIAQLLFSIIHYLYVKHYFAIKLPLKQLIITLIVYSIITIIGLSITELFSIRIIIGIIMHVIALHILNKMKVLNFSEITEQLKGIIS